MLLNAASIPGVDPVADSHTALVMTAVLTGTITAPDGSSASGPSVMGSDDVDVLSRPGVLGVQWGSTPLIRSPVLSKKTFESIGWHTHSRFGFPARLPKLVHQGDDEVDLLELTSQQLRAV